MKTINPSTSLRVDGERRRTIKLYTLGCKVNQYDTQLIREQFISQGFQELNNHHPADVCLVNTCTVTAKADADSLNIIRKAKNDNPGARIIVTGCLAELKKDRAKIKGIGKLCVKSKQEILHSQTGISDFKAHTRAFLKIQDGCNNFCSYCKVPLVRGKSKSRPLKEIIQEAEQLVDAGFKEIVLTGICLGAYGRDLRQEANLVEVIEKLENIKGLLRIRLSSIEAADVTDELIKKISASAKLCRHLHIPIQSADNEILKLMNRRYTFYAYRKLFGKIKNQVAGVAITTDCLVGFPGENEARFRHTLELMKEIMPLKVHIFPFSKREGTKAFLLEEEVEPLIIRERIERLKKAALAESRRFRKQFLNRIEDVLIEGRAKDNPGFWQGFTNNYLKVRVESEKDLKNKVIALKLKKLEKEYILAG